MKKTKAEALTRCVECGQYEPSCSVCERLFNNGDIIYCDNINDTKHYCKKCIGMKK